MNNAKGTEVESKYGNQTTGKHDGALKAWLQCSFIYSLVIKTSR